MPIASTCSAAIVWAFVKFGKRKLLLFEGFLSLTAMGIMMVQRFEALLVAKILIGFGYGFTNTIAPIFIKDINTEQTRGPMIALVQLFLNLGFFFGSINSLFFPNFYQADTNVENYCNPIEDTHIAWREILIFPALLTFIQLTCLIFIFKREDPRYEEYYNRSQITIDSTNSVTTRDLLEQQNGSNIEILSPQRLSRLEKDTWTNLFKREELKKVFSGSMVRFLQQFTGINLVLQFSHFIRLIPNNIFLNLRLVIVTPSILASFLVMWYLQKGPRKPMLLIGSLFACL